MNATEWIDSLGLEAADKAVLQGIAAKKPQAFDGYLAQADYSRKMNELAADHKKLEADFNKKASEVDNFKNTLIQTRGKMNVEYQKAVSERDQAKNALQQVQSRMKMIADQHGIDIEEPGVVIPPTTPIAQPPPAFDPKELEGRFYTRDEAFNDAKGHAILQATFFDLCSEYQGLAGKPPANSRALMAEAVKALEEGRPINFEQLFDQHYGMTDLRTKRQEADRAEREEAIRREERQKIQSEQMVNTATGVVGQQPNSPALRFAEKHAAERAGSPDNTAAARRMRVANMLQEEAQKSVA